jgi:mono/diheme cytochrome c family protein
MRAARIIVLISISTGCASPPAAAPEVSARSRAGAGVPSASGCALQAPARVTPLDGGSAGAGSTIVLAGVDGRTVAYIADADRRVVRAVDVERREQIGATPVAGKPAQLLWSDGRLLVALADRAAVAVLEPGASPEAAMTERCRVPVAEEPVGLAASADGRTIAVTSRWGRALTLLEADELRTSRVVPLERDPHGVVISEDGKTAFVTHVSGGRFTSVTLRDGGARLWPIAATEWAVEHRHSKKYDGHFGEGGNGVERLSKRVDRIGGQGYAIARTKDGRVLAPIALSAPGEGRSGHGYGSVATAVVGGVAGFAADGSTQVRSFVDLGRGGCLLPRSAAVHDASALLLVTCVGKGFVAAYDIRADDKRGPREAWRVAAGEEPVGIAVEAGTRRVVVWSQADATITFAELPSGAAAPQTSTLRVAPAAPEDPALRMGRALFHDAGDRRVALDGRACASCHPDGRDDGLTWATPGGPRQTPMLVGRLDAGPFGWDGKARDLEEHLRRTLERLGGTGLSKTERAALLGYVASLRSPAGAGHDAQARASKGKEIFASEGTGCASCHLEGGGTDALTHDVGSATRVESNRRFDTPSLRFLRQSAPYFHDGRYPTLAALVQDIAETGRPSGRGPHASMGRTDHLNDEERAALTEYLDTL